MGTKVHSKSYLPGFFSMRDLNEDSSSSSWPLCYGDKPVTNGQYFNGFMPRTIVDGYPGYEKDALKRKMLEHEAIFKNQVYELHRLYRIQRDMMEEAKRKDLRFRTSMEPSSSSSHDARKWHMAGFPLLNHGYDRTSISGVEIVNSPMSCTKGSSRPFPFQNGSSLKESEPLDSRPLKVRKKLFDLQLPADEYIDTEEGEKVAESSMKLPIGGQSGVETGSKMNPIRLADLNEPIEIEETVGPSPVDLFDHSSINGESKGVNQLGKSNGGYLGVNEETLHIRNGFLINSAVERKVSERGRIHHTYEAGSSKSIPTLPLPTHPVQGIAIREDLWPNRNHHVLEPSNRSHDHSNNINHLKPLTASQAPCSGPFFNSSCFPSSWPHSVSSLMIKPTNPFTQKMPTLESCLNSTDRTCRTSAQNGFYHGSASGCKAGFDFLSKGDNVISDRSTNHGYGYFSKADSNPAIDLNLNEVVSKPEDHVSALPWLKSKPANESSFFHASSNQLRCKSEIVTDLNQPISASSDCEIVRRKEIDETHVKKILGFPIFGVKIEPPTLATSEGVNHSKEKKKRIIDINLECEPDEQEDLIVEKENQTKGSSLRNYIDLNSCVSDSEEETSYERNTAKVKITLEIDLEAPVTVENEDDPTQLPTQSSETKNKNEPLVDDKEILRNAAEAILSISSSCPKTQTENTILDSSEASLAEYILLFANAEPDSTSQDEEIDDFEAMTLEIQETKQEDYMPTPFVPEFQAAEEPGPNSNTLTTRSRRGQSRRGRQRRDFQRDILPGLASLSRHEVTEDIQTFGGMMRATGHHWVSGPTRRNGARNGGGRGRKRVAAVTPTSPVSAPLVEKLSVPEGGLEDRSLTGWGKTIRRPRRQRCAAGNNNSPAVVLT